MSNKILAAGSVALFGAGSLMGASAANAFTSADCGTVPDGAFINLVNDDICSLTIGYDSSTDWARPAGVDRIAAVVIGGGGGSVSDTYAGYAGGGGEVLYVADVSDTDLETMIVGSGGVAGFGSSSYGDSESGGDTVLGSTVAHGGGFGRDISTSGYSGNGNVSWAVDNNTWSNRFGGGAKSDASENTPGAGYLLSDPELTENDELFPVVDGALEFGKGGSASEIPDVVGRGTGGSATDSMSVGGAEGGIVLRWKIPALASTGVDANSIGMTAGALSLGGIALAVVAAARRARRNK